MIDVFSDLAAQSLGSMSVVQPLILPMFAPAPALISGTASEVSNDIPLTMPEATLWETEPATFIVPEMHHLPEVVETPAHPERQALPPDLVSTLSPKPRPVAVNRDAPALSLRSLIQHQRPVHDWSEQTATEKILPHLLSVSQSAVPEAVA